MGGPSEVAEALAAAADERTQEKGAPVVRPARLARGYIQTVHPDTGLAVTFVPGEALPAWVSLKDADDV
ncbi:hypothetical protein [Nocardioides sp. MH1]|uniref:hypothetical protein n=1 Tax=Nocardioides sp. MH1 TaxID=3242490 RepID=UPI0035211B45